MPALPLTLHFFVSVGSLFSTFLQIMLVGDTDPIKWQIAEFSASATELQ
jgi:hypothetical protein